jgi:hypothetical protein
VCDKCSQHRESIQYFGFTNPVRICNQCIKSVRVGNENFALRSPQSQGEMDTEITAKLNRLSFRHSATSHSPQPTRRSATSSSIEAVGRHSHSMAASPSLARRTKPVSAPGPDEMSHISLNDGDLPFTGVRAQRGTDVMELETVVETNSGSFL